MTDPAYAAQVALTIAVGVTVLLACLTVVAAVAWCLYLAGTVLVGEVRHRVTSRRLHRQARQSGRQGAHHFPGRSFDSRDSPLDVGNAAQVHRDARRFVLDGSEPIHRGAPQ